MAGKYHCPFGFAPSQNVVLATLLIVSMISSSTCQCLTGNQDFSTYLGTLDKAATTVISCPDEGIQGPLPAVLADFNNLVSLELQNNSLTGDIPDIFGTSLVQVDLSNNNLNINENVLNNIPDGASIAIRNNNMDLTCETDLLAWYPDLSSKVSDRHQILCKDVNIYGELKLNPHVLRTDTQAPDASATIKAATISDSKSILLNWEYTGNAQSDINRKINDEVILAQIPSCEDFSVQNYFSGTQEYLGFELSWNNQRECILADKSSIEAQDYTFNISGLNPATDYVVSVQPFFFQLFQFTGKFIFGIQSKTKVTTTLDDIPIAGPSNIRVRSKRDTRLDVEWDEMDISVSNGEVISYDVECLNCKTTDYQAPGNFISINLLDPFTSYEFRVRAETSAGKGPFSETVILQTCAPNLYATTAGKCVNAESGYFYVESTDSASACSSFSNEIFQESCIVGGVRTSSLILQNGYWRPNAESVGGIKVCPKPDFCVTKGTNNSTNVRRLTSSFMGSDQHCAEHHTGVYCSECVDDYRMSSSGCVICDDNDKREDQTKVAIFVVVMLFFIVCYQVKMFLSAGYGGEGKSLDMIPRMKEKMEDISYFYTERISTKLQIFIITTQILFAFQSTLSTKSPGNGNDNVFTTIITLELEKLISVLEIHCYTDVNFYHKLLFVTLSPIVFLALIWIVYLVISKVSDESGKLKMFYQETFNLFILVTFYVYAPVSRTIVRTFLCETIEFETENAEYLRADYRLRCESEEYSSYSAYAWFMVLLYPLGILNIYIYLFHKRRSLFLRREKGEDISQDGEEQLKLVDFLTRPYKNDYYWFEIYELLRRLMMTSFLAIVVAQEDGSASSYAGEAYAFVVVVVSILIVEISRPYKYRSDWLYSLLCLLTLFLATQISLWSEFHVDGEEESKRLKSEYEAQLYLALFWVQIGMFIVFIVVDNLVTKDRVREEPTSLTRADRRVESFQIYSETRKLSI